MTAAALVLLVVGVVGALVRVRHEAAGVVPVAAAVVAVGTGVVSGEVATDALGDLVSPVAFLLVAVPLAVLLDRLDVFEAVARRLPTRRLAPGLWALGAVTVALVNLDAAVVLLVPVVARAARRSGEDPVGLALQPALLASLASSFLPVSNLTNLIAEAADPRGPGAYLTHLGPPSLVGVGAGYGLWRRCWPAPAPAGGDPEVRAAVGRTEVDPVVGGGPPGWAIHPAADGADGADGPGDADVPGGRGDPDRPSARAARRAPADDRAAVVTAAVVGAVLLVGFTAGGAVGVPPWAVAAGVLAGLAVRARHLPVAAVPWASATVVAGLAVLAVAAAGRVDVGAALGSGEGPGGTLRVVGVGAVAANLGNNLPVFLAGWPALPPTDGARWAWLLGVNAGPTLLVSGSLAGLLWLEVARRCGLDVGWRDYLRAGVRVGVPALAAAAAVLALLPA